MDTGSIFISSMGKTDPTELKVLEKWAIPFELDLINEYSDKELAEYLNL